MPIVACIEDLRLLARRRVPRMFYDYVDSGSWTESTYRANEADIAAICFRQRVAINIENRSIRSTMIGEDVALAPTGLCGMQHADGEILAARAAEAFHNDEHLLARGRGGEHHEAILVSTLCDAQQVLYRTPHRQGETSAMLSAHGDTRSSAGRPTNEGHKELAKLHDEIELLVIGAERQRTNELFCAGKLTDEARRRIERELDLREAHLANQLDED